MDKQARALVLGASGMVGQALYRVLTQRGVSVVGTTHTTLVADLVACDLQDAKAVSDLITAIRPAWIFVPAGWTYVDGCEQDPNRSWQINVKPIATIIRAARLIGSQIIYFSSDYIFNGQEGPYSEEACADPLSIYGRHKLATEHYLALYAPQSLIVRTTWVYGFDLRARSFVHTIVRRLKEDRPIMVANDQWGNPTFAGDLAFVTIRLAEQQRRGVWNVVGPERLSRAAWAEQIVQVWNGDSTRITAVPTDSLNLVAARPLQAGLTIDKIHQVDLTVSAPDRSLGTVLRCIRDASQGHGSLATT